ncbi:MbnP family copper-binding protein [Hydrogenophaga sp.]|uniref:MbnP family copper-binding protein n=1 Tax=Hydrogenophaga sp. TaxID=1904254 RepID=UPI0026324120|nr:MbnP family copper-binding protein [Hydrogenophaga sp.]MCW5653121.1 metallo-mystery pair system four-Cys motif protein [Hydrogenophaga sp.]
MKTSRYLSYLSAVSLAALLAACGGGGGEETPAPTTPVPQPDLNISLAFAAMAGSTPIDCSTALTDLGITNAQGGLRDLRFYISNVKLVTSGGAEVPLVLGATDDWNATVGSDRVTLVDLENASGTCTGGTVAMNSEVKGTVPAGTYVGVKMTLGVPFALNHTNQGGAIGTGAGESPAVVNNAVHPGMAWNWAGGRKFAKIEVNDPSWTAPTFNVHLGSTGCTGTNPAAGEVDACTGPNRLDFGFATFDPATQKIAVDVRALLAGNDVTVNGSGPTGCMSGKTDPECVKVFEALAIDLPTGLTVGNGSTQTVFRAVAK